MSNDVCQITGKKMYVSYQHAKNDMSAINRRRDSKDRILSIYTCRHCQHWHVGSKLKEGEPHR